MTTRTSRRIANAVIAADGLFVVASVKLLYGRDLTGQDSADWIFLMVSGVGAAIYLLIGRAIVTRQPANTIGWLLLGIPTLALIAMTNGGYAARALVVAPGSLPFGLASAWVDRWIFIPAFAAFIPLFLLYPDGRLPSPRWRLVGILTFAAPVLTMVAFAITPGRLTGAMSDLGPAHVTNPLGIDAAAGAIDAVTQIGAVLILLSAIASVVAIVVRYRRANAEVRQQIRWLGLIGVAFLVELAAGFLGSLLLGDNDLLGNALFMLMFLTLVIGIPVACGVAILRYRLYDLDLVIRKTLVAAILTAFIGLVYVAIVSGVGALIGSESDSALSFAAAAVLAIAFQPARDRARRIADRLVYGQRATPYEVLSEFSERAGESYSSDDVLPRMAEIVAKGVAAERTTVWLRIGGELRPEATWPPGELGAAAPIRDGVLPGLGQHAVEVRHRGELLGAIGVNMSPSDPLDPAKEKLIEDLAAQAGLVLRNSRLVEELRASRQRLVAAQDEERRKLERNLHDGAQQQLVALQVQLRLAEQLAGTDAEKERLLIHRLQAAAAAALEDLRDLARGIYPPLLADRGLIEALESQARRAPIPVAVDPDGVGRYSREVEVAAYFCVLEALNNVAKYAQATRAVIRLAHDDGGLTFEVTDDGVGFDPASAGYGTGLQGMADRLDAIGGTLDVESRPGRGTTVAGRVPISAQAHGAERQPNPA